MLRRFPTAYFLAAILKSNVVRLPHPYKISWAVTYRCNLRCGMCNIWKRQDRAHELSTAEADRFFAAAGKFSWVGLTGGEPFLREDLGEIADRIVLRTPTLKAIHVNTNGQCGERALRFAERFRERHRRIRLIVTVSIDGPPAVHDRIRGREGAWQRAAAAFADLKKIKGVKAQIGYTISPDNIGCYSATIASLREGWPDLDPDDINVNVFQRSPVYYDNRGMGTLPAEDAAGEIDAILQADPGGFSLNNLLRRTYLVYYKGFLRTGKAPLQCQAFSASCFLDPEGNLYPCVMYNRRFVNVREESDRLETLWTNAEGRKIRKECASQQCPSCWSPCDAFSSIAGSLHRSLFARR